MSAGEVVMGVIPGTVQYTVDGRQVRQQVLIDKISLNAIIVIYAVSCAVMLHGADIMATSDNIDDKMYTGPLTTLLGFSSSTWMGIYGYR